MQKNKPVEDKTFSSITRFLAAELLDDGNVALWANGNDEHDWQKSEGDAFESLEELPFWNQDIAAGFANHVTGPYKTYAVEVKSITVEMIGLRYRKRKAVVIMKLVQGNVTAIPSLHIDIVKDISFSWPTTNGDSQALVLDLSHPVTANEVITYSLQRQGEFYPCDVFDNKFLDRCRRCQVYGHHAYACSGPLRCGKCTGQHRTKLCTSSLTRCACAMSPTCVVPQDIGRRELERLES